MALRLLQDLDHLLQRSVAPDRGDDGVELRGADPPGAVQVAGEERLPDARIDVVQVVRPAVTLAARRIPALARRRAAAEQALVHRRAEKSLGDRAVP